MAGRRGRVCLILWQPETKRAPLSFSVQGKYEAQMNKRMTCFSAAKLTGVISCCCWVFFFAPNPLDNGTPSLFRNSRLTDGGARRCVLARACACNARAMRVSRYQLSTRSALVNGNRL